MVPTRRNIFPSLPTTAAVVALLCWDPWRLCVWTGTSAYAWVAAPGCHDRPTQRRLSTTTTTDSGPFHTVQDALDFVDDVLRNEEAATEQTEDDMIQRVDALHAADVEAAAQSPLISSRDCYNTNEYATVPSFERVHVGDTTSSTVVVRSTDPMLTPQEVATIRTAADAVWARSSTDSTGAVTSRFTHQYPGNSEAHVSDLSDEAVAVVNRALAQTIYPLVSAAFSDEATEDLCVYDALVIRYNATGGTASAGAGQPLHRDLGAVSVNLQLSSQFTGGGTLFEQQLGDEDATIVRPLHPKGVGYGLAHRSTDRHAGAATIQGVRDILVLFLLPIPSTPGLRSARWMQCREYCGSENVLCRIRHQRLAVQAMDHQPQPYGQAHHYLGSALRDYAALQQHDEHRKLALLQAAIACFRHAATLSPYDARIYNDWGIAARGSGSTDDDDERLFRHAYNIVRQSAAAGCNVEHDMDRIALNLGLCLADQDQFAAAAAVLEPTAAACQQDATSSRTVQDAARLWSFCQRQQQS